MNASSWQGRGVKLWPVVRAAAAIAFAAGCLGDPPDEPTLALSLALPQVDRAESVPLRAYADLDDVDGTVRGLRVVVVDRHSVRIWAGRGGAWMTVCYLDNGALFRNDQSCLSNGNIADFDSGRRAATDDTPPAARFLVAADAGVPTETVYAVVGSLGNGWPDPVDLLVQGPSRSPLPPRPSDGTSPPWVALELGTGRALARFDPARHVGIPAVEVATDPGTRASPSAIAALVRQAAGGDAQGVGLSSLGQWGDTAPVVATLNARGVPVGLVDPWGPSDDLSVAPPPREWAWGLTNDVSVVRVQPARSTLTDPGDSPQHAVAYCVGDTPDSDALSRLVEVHAAHVAACADRTLPAGATGTTRSVQLTAQAKAGALQQVTSDGDPALGQCVRDAAETWQTPATLTGPVSFALHVTDVRDIAASAQLGHQVAETVRAAPPGFDLPAGVPFSSADVARAAANRHPAGATRATSATLRATLHKGLPTDIRIDSEAPWARDALVETWWKLVRANEGAKRADPTAGATGRLELHWRVTAPSAVPPPSVPQGCAAVTGRAHAATEAPASPAPLQAPADGATAPTPSHSPPRATDDGFAVRVERGVLALNLTKLKKSNGFGGEQAPTEDLRLPLLHLLASAAGDLAACMPADGEDVRFDLMTGHWGGIRVVSDHCVSPVRASLACVDDVLRALPSDPVPALHGVVRLAWAPADGPASGGPLLPSVPTGGDVVRVGPEIDAPARLKPAATAQLGTWVADLDACFAGLRYWTPDATATIDLVLLFDRGQLVGAEERSGWRLDHCVRSATKGWSLAESLTGPVRLTMAYQQVSAETSGGK